MFRVSVQDTRSHTRLVDTRSDKVYAPASCAGDDDGVVSRERVVVTNNSNLYYYFLVQHTIPFQPRPGFCFIRYGYTV